jgi:hypothetical protein
LYVILMGEPKSIVTIKNLAPKPGSQVYLLGESKYLHWVQHNKNVEVTLPSKLPGHYAYVLKMSAPSP